MANGLLIPAKRVPYFKPGKELKELINDKAGEALQNENLMNDVAAAEQ